MAGDGSFRWYAEYSLPEAFGGGGTLTVRLDLTVEDQKRKFNRTELLSPIPSSDPDFKNLAPLRNDAESNNSALEAKLFNKRAHSVGHMSQRANLLGYALLVNSVTLDGTRDVIVLGAPGGGYTWVLDTPWEYGLRGRGRAS